MAMFIKIITTLCVCHNIVLQNNLYDCIKKQNNLYGLVLSMKIKLVQPNCAEPTNYKHMGFTSIILY